MKTLDEILDSAEFFKLATVERDGETRATLMPSENGSLLTRSQARALLVDARYQAIGDGRQSAILTLQLTTDGRTAPVHYETIEALWMDVTLQKLFDDGRITGCTLHYPNGQRITGLRRMDWACLTSAVLDNCKGLLGRWAEGL
jgi:hypothetical protein